VSRMTTKGQVTVPKAIRDEMGLRPGDEVEFVRANGAYQMQKKVAKDAFEKWRGYLKHLGKTTDEFMREIRGE